MLARQAQAEKSRRSELDEEERRRRQIHAEIKAAKEKSSQNKIDDDEIDEEKFHSLNRSDGIEGAISGTVLRNNTMGSKTINLKKRAISSVFGNSDDVDDIENHDSTKKKMFVPSSFVASTHTIQKSNNSNHVSKDRSEMENIRRDDWIQKNIIVKVISKKVNEGKYYKCKGKILNIHEKYSAELHLYEIDEIVIIHQKYLETVIPQVRMVSY